MELKSSSDVRWQFISLDVSSADETWAKQSFVRPPPQYLQILLLRSNCICADHHCNLTDNLYHCEGCYMVSYCSLEHQVNDHGNHEKISDSIQVKSSVLKEKATRLGYTTLILGSGRPVTAFRKLPSSFKDTSEVAPASSHIRF